MLTIKEKIKVLKEIDQNKSYAILSENRTLDDL